MPKNQMQNTTAATVMTAGVNTPATRSATRAIGAFLELASSTRAMIFERVVSEPTASARISTAPEERMLDDVIFEPSVFLTGRGSPVSALSSQ